MSKGGKGKAAKQREVMERINEAAEKRLLEDTLAEQQAAMEREQRIHSVWWQCRWAVLNRMADIYSLPGEVTGAQIAERMMQAAYQRMLNNALEGRARQEGDDPVRPGDIRLVSMPG